MSSREEAPTRGLAAIMFADMVGFTALMGADEAHARALRDRQGSVLDAAVARHGGEVLQAYGDGTLSVFPSAVEAVECAREIQLELRQEPRVLVRIGVHTGDVVRDAQGVYGDGVNVAERVEALAAPGGVLISGKVYDEVKNHPALETVFVADVRLKNVVHPTRVFALSGSGLPVPSAEEIVGAAGGGSQAPRPAPGSPDAGTAGGAGRDFVAALRERSLVQWAFAYLAGAWAFLEAAGFAADAFAWPAIVARGLVVALAAGFLVTLVVVWYHGERGQQGVTGPELLIIALLLAITGGLLAALGPADGDGAAAAMGVAAEGPGAGPADAAPSVAVLPFDNLSGDAEAEPFSNGVHDDVLTALSKIGGLKVISRTSVLGYRNTDKKIREIGRELGVGAVLEGGVQRAGNRIRINAQLIDARTDAHLWAERFDTVENVFAIQNHIAAAIAEALQAVLAPEDLARLDQVPTESLAAYEAYLSGLERQGRPGWALEDLAAARADFERAAALDGHFAEAHAWLGIVHFLVYRLASTPPRRGWRRWVKPQAAPSRSIPTCPSDSRRSRTTSTSRASRIVHSRRWRWPSEACPATRGST